MTTPFDKFAAANLRGYNVHFLSKARATWDAAVEAAATKIESPAILGPGASRQPGLDKYDKALAAALRSTFKLRLDPPASKG